MLDVHLQDILRRHTTVRRFEPHPVADESLQQLLEAARHGASSCFLQQTSVLIVDDPVQREGMFRIAHQEFVRPGRGTLLVFLIDAHRNAVIRQALRGDRSTTQLASLDNFLQGAEDAMIFAQNTAVLAEASGLGVAYLGNVLNDAQATIDLFELPSFVFPLVGMVLGTPEYRPPTLKPRMPFESIVMHDRYEEPDLTAIRTYDQVLGEYYATRERNSRHDTFSAYVEHRLDEPLTPQRVHLAEAISAQGFQLTTTPSPLQDRSSTRG